MLETCRVDANENQLQSNQVIHSADWERFVDDLGKLITEEQTPKRLLLARSKIYELLTCCIPPELIIQVLLCSRCPHCCAAMTWPCLMMLLAVAFFRSQKLTVVLLKRLDDEIKHEVVQWAAFYVCNVQWLVCSPCPTNTHTHTHTNILPPALSLSILALFLS